MKLSFLTVETLDFGEKPIETIKYNEPCRGGIPNKKAL